MFALFKLHPILELLLFIMLIVIGLFLIIFIAKIFLVLLPAIIVAIIVYYITKNLLLTGIAFIIIAAISLLKS
ncbi:MAG: hypothetical protein J7K82_08910 [Thermoproteales archaeon]|nr:hypothetical protein [Thermoproteales archaeon]